MSEAPAKTRNEQPLGAGLQSLVRTLRVLFFLLRITIILIFVWLLFSGVFFVDDQEEAMLFHFGKLGERVIDRAPTKILTSGRWYWAWPYPIDTVKRIPARRPVTVTTEGHFWPPTNINASEEATRSIQTKSLVPGQGGYLLTQDANIMHAEWSVNYLVNDAQKYYLSFYHDPEVSKKERDVAKQRGIEALVRDLLCNAALTETSLWRAEDMYKGSRSVTDANNEQSTETLQANVKKRLIALVDKLGLGIEILQVNMLKPQPPLATQAAFQRVLQAVTIGAELESNARSYKDTQLRVGEGRAREIEEDAIAYSTRVVESIRADRKYFEVMLEEFRKSPDTILTTLYAEKVGAVLQKVKAKYVIHASPDGNQEIRISLGPQAERVGTADAPADSK
jgi:regulator of protease activity HflC (stomatin/prohibitin superfamily)